MKFLRYGPPGQERPALLDAGGTIRSLHEHCEDLSADTLDPETLRQFANLEHSQLPAVEASARIGPCVGGVGKLACIGLNYSDHAAETGMALPSEPIVFMKATSAICGPYDDLIQPRDSTKLDWEVELAIVIGRGGKYIDAAQALDHVAGYCICNDVSERAFQFDHDGQWTKGKSADTFGPLGPWLVTADEIGDLNALSLSLKVNDETMQQGSTATMVFPVTAIIACLSRYMRLEPGDVIATGTPPGVGFGQNPPRYLHAGDVVEAAIEGLGVQRQVVVAET